jgi:hypothetical protein
MKNYSHLGHLQSGILRLLRDEQYERSYIYQEIRNTAYKSPTNKAQSRQAIRRAIRTLKQRGLITEHYGILVKL